MKSTFKFIILIFLYSFISSCQKEFSIENNLQIGYDPDAKKFIDASGITDSTEKVAINNLVSQLKFSSLWSKLIAIYPMVGNSASTTKWNLKDPRDLDAAYRLTFYGSPVYASPGVLFPTLNDFADTHFTDNSISFDDASMSYYSTTQNSISGYDMGCTDGAIPYNELSVYSNSADKSEWFGFSQFFLSPSTTGLFMQSSSASNVTRYQNGAIVSSKGSAPNNKYTDLTILIGKSRVTMHPGQKQCGLATIGEGFSDSEALAFYNIVQNFETMLGR